MSSCSGKPNTSESHDILLRGAYCAAVVISLLNIPLNLSSDSPASAAGLDDLYTGLANYVQRCEQEPNRYTLADDAD